MHLQRVFRAPPPRKPHMHLCKLGDQRNGAVYTSRGFISSRGTTPITLVHDISKVCHTFYFLLAAPSRLCRDRYRNISYIINLLIIFSEIILYKIMFRTFNLGPFTFKMRNSFRTSQNRPVELTIPYFRNTEFASSCWKFFQNSPCSRMYMMSD